MLSAKERLSQLLALAAERRWSPLARELCDLILYWPSDYPDAMRPPMQALCETALREADAETQSVLAGRLAGRSDIPLKLINPLYLAASPPQRREILMRNALESKCAPSTADETAILAAARSKSGDFSGALMRLTSLPRAVTMAALNDTSGEPLAVLCRGLGLSRACFSALALLRGAEGIDLSAFDTVAPEAAASLVADWRKTHGADAAHERYAAAE